MRDDLAQLTDQYLSKKGRKKRRDFERHWSTARSELEDILSAEETVRHLEYIPNGYLVLTSRRLLFTGSGDFSIPTSDIVSSGVEAAYQSSKVRVTLRSGKTMRFEFWQDKDGAIEFNEALKPIILRK